MCHMMPQMRHLCDIRCKCFHDQAIALPRQAEGGMNELTNNGVYVGSRTVLGTKKLLSIFKLSLNYHETVSAIGSVLVYAAKCVN